MASFIVRIELRGGALVSDYARLHEKMAEAGLARTIESDKGAIYNLPSGTYAMKSDVLTLQEVYDLADSTAQSVKAGPLVLVTKGDSQWSLVVATPTQA